MPESIKDKDIDDSKNKPTLPIALGIAVVISLVLTVVSVIVYYDAGFYKFDLSRPGYEAERQDIATDSGPRTYDTASPVNAAALDSFLGDYDANVNTMRAYGDFGDATALSNQALLLEPNATE